MSTSYATTLTESFTVTPARHLASKVAADLLRLQRFYGEPSNAKIDTYEQELVAMLKNDYVERVTYGFKRDDNWITAVRYRVVNGLLVASDDDPGKIKPGEDVTGASFGSFLIYSSNWYALSQEAQSKFEGTLPFRRSTGTEPGVENGWWNDDLTYSAGGRGISRSTITR